MSKTSKKNSTIVSGVAMNIVCLAIFVMQFTVADMAHAVGASCSITSFVASSQSVPKNSTVDLSWSTSDSCVSATLDSVKVPVNGQKTSAAITTAQKVFTLKAIGGSDMKEVSQTVTVTTTAEVIKFSEVQILSPRGGESFLQGGAPVKISWKNGYRGVRVALIADASQNDTDGYTPFGWIVTEGKPTGDFLWDTRTVKKYINNDKITVPVPAGEYRMLVVSQNQDGEYLLVEPGLNASISTNPFTIVAQPVVAATGSTTTTTGTIVTTGTSPATSTETLQDISIDLMGATGVDTGIQTVGGTGNTTGLASGAGMGSITPQMLVAPISLGTKSEEVKKIQQILKKKGFLKVKNPTMLFGKGTRDAVKRFQKKQKIKVTGIIDQETYTALMSVAPTKSTAVAPKKYH